jgi:fructuronate reductase
MVPLRQPVRAAHLGLGAFFRAHQAWYTQVAGDWGIAAFTGRSATAAEELAAQSCRYGLIVRGADGDTASVIESVVEARDGASAAWLETLANPEVALVTMTVTEAGYLPAAAPPRRLLDGMRARRDAGAGPLAIVPCDNLPANGTEIRDAVLALARDEPGLGAWIADSVSFVSTMVDRITPATTDGDRAIARDLLGWDDRVPVVTEPFTEWVLEGAFPGGRPAWEAAGARFVDDVRPYENRKLWLLNGAHSLLAYRGLERGFETVFDAFADAALSSEVEQLWAEAREVLDLDAGEVDAWLAELRIRWQNPRIEHRLEQIALGGEQKIPARIGAVLERRREAGLGPGEAELETIGAWERYSAAKRDRKAQQ